VTAPLIEAGDCTVGGSNTAGATWAVPHPAASTGDLLIWNIAWDDSTSVTDVTEPSGANGETLSEINATPIYSNSTEVGGKCWWTICTGAWTQGTLTFTPSATESWTSTVIRVPAGEFDAADPIGNVLTRSSANTTDTTVENPVGDLASNDGGGRLVWFAFVDADALSGTNPSGWTIRQAQDLGAVAHGIATRDAQTTNSETVAETTWGIAGDSWGGISYVVRGSPNLASGSGTLSALTGAGTGTSVSVYQGNAWMPGAWASGAWAAGAWEVTATTHSGSGAGTIAASTGAGTGTKARAGTGAGTLAASTGSGTGLKARSGTGAGTVTAATGIGTGTFYSQFYGSGAGDLAALTGSGTGLKARSGLGAGTLTALTGSGTGAAAGQFYGTGAGTIAASTGSGTGLKERAGTGAGVIAALTGAGTGTSAGVFTGSGAGTITALTGSGTGSSVEMVCAWDHGAWAPGAWASGAWQCAPLMTDGIGTGTIAALTGSGTGTSVGAPEEFTGSGAGTIAALTGSGTGVEDTWILVSFATPTTNPTPGTDLQAFRVLVRKTDTANPTVDIALYEAGSFVATLVSGTSVTSDTGQTVTATWDAALLSDPTGADVECYVYGHSNGVSQVEIGAIAWDVTQGFTGSGAGTVAELTGSGTGLRSHASTGAGTIAAATGSGTGTSEGPQTWVGSGTGTFPALTGSGTGLRGAKGSGTGTIAVTGTGTGDYTTTWIGTGAAALGIVVGSGTGARPHAGSGAGTISALTGAGNGPQTGKVGGDDRPRHPGWSKKRATLKLKRERELTEQIRDIYRELTADPETAAQAETILAPVIPPTPATGETEAARVEAIEARAEALRRRADAMDARAIEAEIALRVLYRQLREQMIADDWAAIEALLPEVL
jgi:hypothetical protein